jgi:hypothetical protein
MSLRNVFGRLLLVFFCSLPAFAEIPPGYTGKPYQGTPLSIPGIFYADRADSGANGVAFFHPGNTNYQAMLKMTGIDFGFDCVLPGSQNDVTLTKGEIYWAYIEPNEWMKATINVTAAGQYTINMLATNGDDAKSRVVNMLLVVYNGTDSVRADTLKMPYIGTCGAYDFHSWFVAKGLDTITLKAGVQVMKVVSLSNGPFNVGWTELKALSTGVQHAALPVVKSGLRLDNLTVTNDAITARFFTTVASPARISLFDARGRMLCAEAVSSVREGTNNISLKGTFVEGVYLVRISQAGRTIEGRAVAGR